MYSVKDNMEESNYTYRQPIWYEPGKNGEKGTVHPTEEEKNNVTINPSKIPRLLTPGEISSIVDKLPYHQSSDKDNAAIARASTIEWLRNELSEVYLTEDAIPDMIDAIVSSYVRAQIAPGTSVGIQAAEGLGAATTQMTLNTFKESGTAKNISFGIVALQEMIFVRKSRKFEWETIFFKDKFLSFNQVFDMRSEIVGCSLEFFLFDYTIDTVENLKQYWWNKEYSSLIDPVGKKQIPESRSVLRIYLEVEKLYAYRVTMEQYVSVIEKESPPSVRCVHFPISGELYKGKRRAIIDIFPVEKASQTKLKEKGYFDPQIAPEVFLKVFVLSAFGSIRIKGISGITKLIPVISPVWQIVLSEKPFKVRDAINMGYTSEFVEMVNKTSMWKLTLNKNKMRQTGIGIFHLIRLLQTISVSLVGFNSQVDPDFALVTTPENVKVSPGRYLMGLIEVDDALVDQEQTKTGYRPPDSPLRAAANYIYADVDGTNLYQTLAHKDVDATRTFCNNIHTTAQVLGIEAARTLFTREISDIISTAEGYVNPQIISLVADFVTNRGVPLGVTYASVSRQPVGPLSLATMERAINVLRDAAASGKTENMKTPSASIITGQLPSLGSSAVDIIEDPIKLEKFRKQLEEKNAGRSTDDPYLINTNTIIDGLNDFDNINIESIGNPDNSILQTDVIPNVNPGITSGTTTNRIASNPDVSGTIPPIRTTSTLPQIKSNVVVSNTLMNALKKFTSLGLPQINPSEPKLVITPLTGGIRSESLITQQESGEEQVEDLQTMLENIQIDAADSIDIPNGLAQMIQSMQGGPLTIPEPIQGLNTLTQTVLPDLSGMILNPTRQPGEVDVQMINPDEAFD